MEKLYSCRKCVLFCLCVLFIILSTEAVSKAQINYEFEKYILFDYRTTLEVKCNVTLSAPDEKVTFSWLKGGVPWKAVEHKSKQTDTTDSSTLSVSLAVDQDAGEYSCVVAGAAGPPEIVNVTVALKPFVKLPDYTNVVEGEKLSINCIVHGVPVPKIRWTIVPDEDINRTTTYSQSGGDVKIMEHTDKEKGASGNSVPNAALLIDEAAMKHRGTYSCYGEAVIGSKLYNSSSGTYLRVKDKMAALWPFLGICTEVVVLCAVILIYEKKRNKTEMEESDTDGSPEQKNTPDHGKDSEVRHRK